MNLSPTAGYISVRAKAEVQAANRTDVYPEYYFLAIMKLSELSANELFPNAENIKSIDREIQEIAESLKRINLFGSEPRARVRRILANTSLHNNAETALAQLYARAAEMVNDGEITALNLLNTLINDPPTALKAVINKQEPAQNNAKAGKPNALRDISAMMQKLSEVRIQLLDAVIGQDLAVNTFIDGVLNSEITASAETRTTPKSIFAFVGPPGVGKSLLAEQSAKLLGIPCKRYDMSGYANADSHQSLIGFDKTWKGSHPGELTEFVKNNPESILIFDEIEKSHLFVIHLFLQVLDSGKLKDSYTAEDIEFKNTIIIFTSNAGRSLYEKGNQNLHTTRHAILNALETENNPQTGLPFFPSAICSRLGKGYPILFRHLETHHLISIAEKAISHTSDLFFQQYGFRIKSGFEPASLLLFREGGAVDARKFVAQSERFVKDEMVKLFRLYGDDFTSKFKHIKEIEFIAEKEELVKIQPNGILEKHIAFWGNADSASSLQENVSNIVVHNTNSVDDLVHIVVAQNIDLIMFEISLGADDSETMAAFRNVPIAAHTLSHVNRALREVQTRFSDIPIYVIDCSNTAIDDNLRDELMLRGVREILRAEKKVGWGIKKQRKFDVISEDIMEIIRRIDLQHKAQALAAESKVLVFETAPKIVDNERKIVIRFRNLELKRSTLGSDLDILLDESSKPNVMFEDVIGATSAKIELSEFIEYVRNPKKYLASGIKPPKGILLYGSPGTGKTLLAKAMAGESGATFIPTVGSSFVTKYAGSGEQAVRDLFIRARRYAPTIVFIDEIDVIGRPRSEVSPGHAGHSEANTLNALLSEMDGFATDNKRPVLVLAATNFGIDAERKGIGTLDEALLRRFEVKIEVGLPEKSDRLRYFQVKLSGCNNVTVAMIDNLSSRSVGLSLARLEAVIESAKRMSSRLKTPLDDKILEDAFETTLYGEKTDWGVDYLQRVARHEAGHAIMEWQSSNDVPSYLTIVARGNHGGYMQHDDVKKPLLTKNEIIYKIRTALAGRAAEVVYYGDTEGLSSGIANDLEKATRLAHMLICNYGMDEKIGLIAISDKEAANGPLSIEITEQITHLLKDAFQSAVITIEKHRNSCDRLVEALLSKNSLMKEDILAILSK